MKATMTALIIAFGVLAGATAASAGHYSGWHQGFWQEVTNGSG